MAALLPDWLHFLRWLHIMGATVLLGTGAGIAFFMLMAHRTGEPRLVAHVARTVVRRAERDVISLSRAEEVRAETIRYLNRLSDLLFVIARVLAREGGAGEVLWDRNKRG